MQKESKPWISVEEALQQIEQNDTGPRRHFVILGAGVAGLAAALELIARRHTVLIVEGSERVGGRVHTHRFANGAYGELGAMRIPGEHDYTYHYLDRTNLRAELRPFPNSHPNGMAFLRGTISHWNDDDFKAKILPLYTGLSAAEHATLAETGPGGLLGALMTPLFDSLSDADVRALLAGDFSDPRLAALDDLTWRDYLRQGGHASEDAQEILGAWLGLRMPWQWSMAAILRDELNHTTDKLVEIAGGLDRLPTEMAKLLPEGTIRFNTRVEGIESRDGDGGIVHLRDTQTGIGQIMPFAQMLCTLPFPVLGKLPLGLRGFSAAKLDAITGLGNDYSTATKILFQYDQRWWEKQPHAIPGGRSMTEEPALQTYFPTPASASPALLQALANEHGRRRRFALYTGDTLQAALARSATLGGDVRNADTPGVMLASYSFNELAKDFTEMSAEEATSVVLANLQRMHPEMEAPRESVVWSWDKSPWAGRAFALTRPGTLRKYFQSAARPEGSIYFAGEHVSIAPAWIQGALESSLREVARMVKWPPSST